jgi:hypothetical protein
VWPRLLEWCADLFGVTTRSRIVELGLVACALFVIGFVLGERYGILGPFVPAGMLVVAILAARQVMIARDRAWKAACAPLVDLGPIAAELPPVFGARTAMSLHHLGDAVAAARGSHFIVAQEALDRIDRELLRPEEVHLVEAVRALVSLGLGDTSRAARQAIVALPTGVADLDAHLGRTLIADAWNDDRRLRATLGAWQRAGVGADKTAPLAKLERLVRVRIDPRILDAIPSADARDLADEARMIGDETLASELDARGRASAYR